jgi:hypothetical protein
VAECLRQVEGACLQEGGWVGGDAWFGSIMSCVELMKKLKVYSTFIVKTNNFLYPMQALYAILKARHGDRPAGKWVVMTTTIADVKLIAIAYAWSMKGTSYFISTCGSTEKSHKLYNSNFQNEFGMTDFKSIERPDIVDFFMSTHP